MKLKILSLLCAFGIFALGTNAMAQDEKSNTTMQDEMMVSGAMPIDPAPAPNPTFCENNKYCSKTIKDKNNKEIPNPDYSATICNAICTAYTAAHGFIVGQLCSDPAVDPKKTKFESCKTLCAPTGATLNDLGCCLTQVGDNLSMVTKAKLAGICKGSFGTTITKYCSFLPLANYGGWLCCPRDGEYMPECLKAANPAWTCKDQFTPKNCPVPAK